MSTPWPTVRLGDLLRERKDRIGAWDAAGLPLLGVSNAQGLHRSGLERIADMSRYLRVESEWFAYNPMRINVGSIGFAANELQTGVISPDYVVFSCTDQIDPRLVFWFLKHPRGLAAINAETAGSVRHRLYFDSLAKIRFPLPPLAEQRRIVARIEELAAKIAEARGLRESLVAEIAACLSAAQRSTFPKPTTGVVGDRVRFQTGFAFKSEWFTQTGVRLARNANVSHGHLDWSDTVRVAESRRPEFAAFELAIGDILVSLDRPIISTGVKVAQIRESDLPALLLQRVARARFITAEVETDYFFRWLQSPQFTSAIDPGRSNGVPHISHKDIERIPFALPSRPEQRRIVAHLDALQAKVDALKALQQQTATELDALLPAILDRAFKGELFPTASSATLVTHAPADRLPASSGRRWTDREVGSIQTAASRHYDAERAPGRLGRYKLGFLAAAACGAEFESPPINMPRGPFNAKAQARYEDIGKLERWHDTNEWPGGSVRYPSLERNGDALLLAREACGDAWPRVDALFKALRDGNDDLELLSTVHGSWNLRIRHNLPCSAEDVLGTVWAWHKSKDKYTPADVSRAMSRLKVLGIEPTGGVPTVEMTSPLF